MASTSNVNSGFEQFGLKLYQDIVKTNPNGTNDNTFISPVSIALAISMCAAGARQNTLDQMLKGFGSKSADELNHTAQQVMKVILSVANAELTGLKLANRLYAQQDYQIRHEYLSCLKQYYSTDLKLIDFKKNSEKALNDINGWVEDQTNHLIKNLLTLDNVRSDTSLILVNCIYFKGTWQDRFDEKTVKHATFTSENGTQSTIPLMFQTRIYAYNDNSTLQAQIAHIPYKSSNNNNFVLTIVLPKQGVRLTDIEKKLEDGQLLKQALTNESRQELNLYLPKFKMECLFDLNLTMKNLGMTDAFGIGVADFSGIEPTGELVISKVIHKAFINVNEYGSEAAAATAVLVVFGSSPSSHRSKAVEFKCDRPFLFMIREAKHDITLFAGRYAKPPES